MSASLRALLAQVIDYAGLFPPAKLPLDQAIHNYAHYRQEPESWMLGRFICPAARLGELAPFKEGLHAQGALRLSVLGRGGSSTREFLQGLLEDLEAILAFNRAWGERAVVEVLELKVPATLVAADVIGDLRTSADGAVAMLEDAGLARPAAFVEIDPGPGFQARAGLVLRALANDLDHALGFKLRCGGLQASAFPPPGEIAAVVVACRDAGVPVKFTAGLHHPIRRVDASVQTHMHGFLNVFAAGVLARVHDLSEGEVAVILADEDARHFAFDEAGLRWKDLSATTDEIASARRELVTSFGSCSFDEPRDDVRGMGLLV